MKQSEERVKRQIDVHDIISFDVFDTLIERKCDRPTNVFRIMEDQLDEKGFARRRMEAEKNARIRSTKEEVTLDDIYESFDGLSFEKREQYKIVELECEKSQSTPRTIGKNLFEYAKDKGKRILIISDMYLPEAFIGSLLAENGYRDYEKLYVSSKSGLRKKTGNLYRKIEVELQVDIVRQIHIGDDIVSDFYGARKAGIYSVLL